jgi:hypothetical protein
LPQTRLRPQSPASWIGPAQGSSSDIERSATARLWAWGVVLVTSGGLAAGVMLAPAAPKSATTVSLSSAGALGWLLFVGTSVHVAATGCLFMLPEVRGIARRNRRRCWWAPAGLMALAPLVSALVSPSRLALALLVVFAWQFWHYQKQNLGMVALATGSHRVAAPTRGERRAIRSAGISGVLGLIAHPRLLGVDVRFPLAPLWVLAEVLLAASAGCGLVLLARRHRADRPYAFSAIYVLSLLFWAPLFVFGSPYAAVGGLTIAHGFQYLLLVGLVLAGPASTSSRTVRLGLALNMALLAGALLSWASHMHSSPAPFRALFGAYMGVLMAHFAIDGHLWRLRDPAVRAFVAARAPFLVAARVVPVAGGSASGIG